MFTDGFRGLDVTLEPVKLSTTHRRDLCSLWVAKTSARVSPTAKFLSGLGVSTIYRQTSSLMFMKLWRFSLRRMIINESREQKQNSIPELNFLHHVVRRKTMEWNPILCDFHGISIDIKCCATKTWCEEQGKVFLENNLIIRQVLEGINLNDTS